MFNLFEAIKNNLLRPNDIKTDRIPTHMPSKAMCYSVIDKKPLGTCIRAAYLSRLHYPVSNPLGIYTKMTTEAGKLWETWITDQYKQLGIYLNHSVKLYDPVSFISGEIDIVHYNPENGEVELSEIKQYNGSNYYAAQELTGTKNQHPRPKDQNLLQSFTYILSCRNTENNVKYINLVYIDRSCASYSNNVQFRISAYEANGEVYPQVEYFNSNGEVTSYVDYRITENALNSKNETLDACVEAERIPLKDFNHQYPPAIIDDMLRKKEISEARYRKWQQDPAKNPIGDWQCRFCPYGPNLEGTSTCHGIKE